MGCNYAARELRRRAEERILIKVMSCIPDIKTTTEMYDKYCSGLSLEDVADEFGVSRQTVFIRFKRRELKMRPIPSPNDSVIWSGRKYSMRDNGYYALTNGDRNYLHRDVWEATHGPIPDGFDVHHKDEDKTNNSILNLEIHTKSQHGLRHGFGGNQYTGSLGRRPIKREFIQ